MALYVSILAMELPATEKDSYEENFT